MNVVDLLPHSAYLRCQGHGRLPLPRCAGQHHGHGLRGESHGVSLRERSLGASSATQGGEVKPPETLFFFDEKRDDYETGENKIPGSVGL